MLLQMYVRVQHWDVCTICLLTAKVVMNID